MNTELGLKSVTRRRKTNYEQGAPHKVFPNLIRQDFSSAEINQKWCTDFTYLYLKNGDVRYNCSILDLHDRIVVSSMSGPRITAELAIRTLDRALRTQKVQPGTLILHSDQGSQFTSKEFVEFCEKMSVMQSMSKAGYPYDNAVMERYFNTLKNEYVNQHEFDTDEDLYAGVNEFAYVTYNHLRPHTYNDNLTPFEARYRK